MNSLTATPAAICALEGGRVALGEQSFGCRGGSYRTYQVRLSAKSAAFLEEGDTVRWWDSGPNELPDIPCGGEIVKRDGSRVQLRGSRDVGIDSGHPPHLTLRMEQRLKVDWVGVDGREDIYLIKEEESGRVFEKRNLFSPSCPLGELTPEILLSQEGAREISGSSLPPLPQHQRWLVRWDDRAFYGWREGAAYAQRKEIRMCDTDQPLILTD